MLEAADIVDIGGKFDPEKVEWRSIVPESAVQPHARHSFEISSPMTATHVRLNIYPDGGVARLRLLGTAD